MRSAHASGFGDWISDLGATIDAVAKPVTDVAVAANAVSQATAKKPKSVVVAAPAPAVVTGPGLLDSFGSQYHNLVLAGLVGVGVLVLVKALR